VNRKLTEKDSKENRIQAEEIFLPQGSIQGKMKNESQSGEKKNVLKKGIFLQVTNQQKNF